MYAKNDLTLSTELINHWLNCYFKMYAINSQRPKMIILRSKETNFASKNEDFGLGLKFIVLHYNH